MFELDSRMLGRMGWQSLAAFSDDLFALSYVATSCSLYFLLFHFLFPFLSRECRDNSFFIFSLVLTYGSVCRWVEGGGTPGHLLMGGGV